MEFAVGAGFQPLETVEIVDISRYCRSYPGRGRLNIAPMRGDNCDWTISLTYANSVVNSIGSGLPKFIERLMFVVCHRSQPLIRIVQRHLACC